MSSDKADRAADRSTRIDRQLADEIARRQETERRHRELMDESPVAIWEEDWSELKTKLDDLARQGVTDWHGHFDKNRELLRAGYDSAETIELSLATVKLFREETKEDLLRMSSAEWAIEEEVDAFRDTILAFLAGQTSFDYESKDIVGDDDLEIIVRTQVAIPPRYRHNWSRVIYTFEDVTERVRAEEQLREAQKWRQWAS